MGSIKNKRYHRNSHRHTFRRRWHVEKYQEKACTHVEESGRLDGSRIINLEKLQEYINTLTVHAAECGGAIILSGEKRDGLASIVLTRCTQCDHSIQLQTSCKVNGPKGYSRWECNLAVVWGQMSTGGGTLNFRKPWEFWCSSHACKAFYQHRLDIGEWWKSS